MKMVKSLLLGSAAGLVAVTAGQAADLPVKAKPVEYVKVCSLYGAGFYYMPGTDMCIKIGGWMRVEVTEGNDAGSMTWGPYSGQNNTRSTSNFVVRERGYITADAREQTAYGTARAYIDVGLSDSATAESNGGQGTFSSNRAFLQWAGITAGLTQSFYDFYSAAAVAYRAAFFPIEDTGDGGNWVTAYTAQLGNGLSATIAIEDRRDTQIIGDPGHEASTVTGTLPNGGNVFSGAVNSQVGYGGYQAPDIVGNLRIDQTWGSAQVMGAAHEVNATYYNPTVAFGVQGHPGDTWGWVVGAGLRLNFPMVAQGDYFQGEVNYTQGALRYLNQPTQGNYMALTGDQATYGIMSDCVFGNSSSTAGTGCNLTTAWSVNASYEHYWTPAVHESFVGAYEAVSYNSQANAMLCQVEGQGGGTPPFASAFSGCNNNWSVWGLSTRLQWDITKSFYMGVEALYTHMDSASSSTGHLPVPLGPSTAGVGLGSPPVASPSSVTIGGSVENAWAFTWRMHKDFLP